MDARRPSSQIIFAAWAKGGLTLPRLVRQAATEAGVEVPDPNAAMGSPLQIEQTAAQAGLVVRHLAAVEYLDELTQADGVAWDRVIGSEHGSAMRTADDTVQAQARDRFLALLATAIRDGVPNISRAHVVEVAAATTGD